jgi:glycosyltransferase involved in cell wall biosynthesis
MLALDVIVRTLADTQRSDLLFRALDSIQNQRGVSARPIVVVNGDRYDPCTLAELERRPNIVLHRLQRASTADAVAEGRRLVTASYFAYLDDDDVLIPDSLLGPLEWLESDADCDVLISNGYFVKEGGELSEFIHISDHIKIGQPALSLLDDGWLAPGTSIFRTKSIPQDMLDSHRDQMEWTYLAFEICAAKKRLHFMNIPTALYYDTPGSMSKHVAHQEAALDLMRSIRSDRRMSRDVRRKADRKYHRLLHILAAEYRKKADLRRAWRYHLASMRPPYTFDYLLFSRKLLRSVPPSSEKLPHST